MWLPGVPNWSVYQVYYYTAFAGKHPKQPTSRTCACTIVHVITYGWFLPGLLWDVNSPTSIPCCRPKCLWQLPYIWSHGPRYYLVHSCTSALYIACPLAELGAYDNIEWFGRKGNSLKHSTFILKVRYQIKYICGVSHEVLWPKIHVDQKIRSIIHTGGVWLCHCH